MYKKNSNDVSPCVIFSSLSKTGNLEFWLYNFHLYVSILPYPFVSKLQKASHNIWRRIKDSGSSQWTDGRLATPVSLRTTGMYIFDVFYVFLILLKMQSQGPINVKNIGARRLLTHRAPPQYVHQTLYCCNCSSLQYRQIFLYVYMFRLAKLRKLGLLIVMISNILENVEFIIVENSPKCTQSNCLKFPPQSIV